MGNKSSNQNIEKEIKEIKEQRKMYTIEQVGEKTDRLSIIDNTHDLSMGMNTNDDKHQYKNILKTLYKNNLTSLTYEDMNAYFIQMNWKHLVFSRNLKVRKGIIDIIYSRIDYENNATQKRFFDILDIKEYPYRCYDLVKYKALRSVVKV